MSHAALALLLFTLKMLVVVIFLLLLFAGILAIASSGKQKSTGKVRIKSLNKHYSETTETLLADILPKKQFKKFIKDQKLEEKSKQKALETSPPKNIFVIRFEGDIKASAVESLREEVTAILGISKPHDEVVVCVESAGGMVHAYGLAAAQLQRIRNKQLTLTVIVDKVAASGGYLMASVANKILAAPFAIIGSIGVIVQLPNFHRLLKENHVDFEQVTAGNFKRTLTVFGQNTEEGREKLKEEINSIHDYFKKVIQQNRAVDIEKVATGEHWLASEALNLNLVDELTTSDDYLLSQSKTANLYEVCYKTKKTFLSKFISSANLLKEDLLAKDPLSRA